MIYTVWQERDELRARVAELTASNIELTNLLRGGDVNGRVTCVFGKTLDEVAELIARARGQE